MQHKHDLSREGGLEWVGIAGAAMTVPLKITQHRLFGGHFFFFFLHSWHTDSGSKNVSKTQVGVFQHLKYHRGTKHVVSVGWGWRGKPCEKCNFIIEPLRWLVIYYYPTWWRLTEKLNIRVYNSLQAMAWLQWCMKPRWRARCKEQLWWEQTKVCVVPFYHVTRGWQITLHVRLE